MSRGDLKKSKNYFFQKKGNFNKPKQVEVFKPVKRLHPDGLDVLPYSAGSVPVE